MSEFSTARQKMVDGQVRPSDVTDLRIIDALLAVREVGPSRFADSWAGVASGTPESDDVLVVYLHDPAPAVEVEITSMAGLPEAKLRFETAFQPLQEAMVVDTRLQADAESLRGRGLSLQTFGIGVDGVEEIGLDHPTDEQIAHLFATYGPYLRIDPDVGPATLL